MCAEAGLTIAIVLSVIDVTAADVKTILDATCRRWKSIAGVLLLALVSLGILHVLKEHQTRKPLALRLWYWHSPFHLAPGEVQALGAMGVTGLFVRAGTLSAVHDGVQMILPQRWHSSRGAPPVDLVFVLDSGVIRHFSGMSNARMVRGITDAYARQLAEATAAGMVIGGVQLDFDCATRLLPKYADLLRQLRRALPAGTVLSITALPTWFGSPDLRDLVRQVDFYCPQFYETQIGRTLAEAQPVADVRALARGLAAASRLNTPFFAGIPTYGHAFIFDDGGRLLGTYRGMAVSEAMRHPAFRQVCAWPAGDAARQATGIDQWIGEEFVDLLAVHPGRAGKGSGYHLLYSLPASPMLARAMALIHRHRPRNCLGAAIFRWPEPGEIMALPVPTLAAVLGGRKPMPRVTVSLQVAPSPWERVEAGESELSCRVTIALTNAGDARAGLSSDAVTVTLVADQPGIEAIPGDFDAVELRAPSGQPAGPGSATTVVARCSHLNVGETITLGPLRISGRATTLYGEWRVKGPGGFTTFAGELQPVRLHMGKDRL